jgi:hypothetical protein
VLFLQAAGTKDFLESCTWEAKISLEDLLVGKAEFDLKNKIPAVL